MGGSIETIKRILIIVILIIITIICIVYCQGGLSAVASMWSYALISTAAGTVLLTLGTVLSTIMFSCASMWVMLEFQERAADEQKEAMAHQANMLLSDYEAQQEKDWEERWNSSDYSDYGNYNYDTDNSNDTGTASDYPYDNADPSTITSSNTKSLIGVALIGGLISLTVLNKKGLANG